jgi:hypothetical protein
MIAYFLCCGYEGGDKKIETEMKRQHRIYWPKTKRLTCGSENTYYVEITFEVPSMTFSSVCQTEWHLILLS